ncbi:Putative ribonuclease H protein At1g65750 [Linum perenne]
MKLIWSILKEPNKIWVKVVTTKYIKSSDSGFQLRSKVWNPPRDDDRDDELLWGPDPREKFTLKSAYEFIVDYGTSSGSNYWKTIWNRKGPSLVKHFLWLVAHDRILTNAKHFRRKMVDSDRYNKCMGAREDTLHVLQDRPLAKDV